MGGGLERDCDAFEKEAVERAGLEVDVRCYKSTGFSIRGKKKKKITGLYCHAHVEYFIQVAISLSIIEAKPPYLPQRYVPFVGVEIFPCLFFHFAQAYSIRHIVLGSNVLAPLE